MQTKFNKQIPTLNKSLKIKLNEHFIIESIIKPKLFFQSQLGNGTITYTTRLLYATKFASINTALQFNRIVEGRIASVFNWFN